jgi:hypothetical protein
MWRRGRRALASVSVELGVAAHELSNGGGMLGLTVRQSAHGFGRRWIMEGSSTTGSTSTKFMPGTGGAAGAGSSQNNEMHTVISYLRSTLSWATAAGALGAKAICFSSVRPRRAGQGKIQGLPAYYAGRRAVLKRLSRRWR